MAILYNSYDSADAINAYIKALTSIISYERWLGHHVGTSVGYYFFVFYL